MKTLTGIFVFLILTSTTVGQRICASEEYNREFKNTNNHKTQAKGNQSNQNKGRDVLPDEIINIPVVVHIIYNNAVQNISEAQVLSQITSLNNDFSNENVDKVNRPDAFKSVAADTKIRFCLAQVSPNGFRTTGIIRKYTSKESFVADDAMKSSLRGGDDAWDATKYLNIWVCAFTSRAIGYSSIPGTPADKDGVVIAYNVFGTIGNLRHPFNKGRTLTHEVGHWLGLKHLWGDGECGNDEVDDTPSQQTYHFGCPVFPTTSSCSPDANGDMFMNYMDFSDDACMNMFTIGQKNRMRNLFASNNVRNSFLTSFACDSNLAQGGPLPEPGIKATIVSIYPNPIKSSATVDYTPANENVENKFVLYNSVGIKVLSGIVKKGKNNLNLSSLQTGVYILKIGEGENKKIEKIIKQ